MLSVEEDDVLVVNNMRQRTQHFAPNAKLNLFSLNARHNILEDMRKACALYGKREARILNNERDPCVSAH